MPERLTHEAGSVLLCVDIAGRNHSNRHRKVAQLDAGAFVFGRGLSLTCPFLRLSIRISSSNTRATRRSSASDQGFGWLAFVALFGGCLSIQPNYLNTNNCSPERAKMGIFGNGYEPSLMLPKPISFNSSRVIGFLNTMSFFDTEKKALAKSPLKPRFSTTL